MALTAGFVSLAALLRVRVAGGLGEGKVSVSPLGERASVDGSPAASSISTSPNPSSCSAFQIFYSRWKGTFLLVLRFAVVLESLQTNA